VIQENAETMLENRNDGLSFFRGIINALILACPFYLAFLFWVFGVVSYWAWGFALIIIVYWGHLMAKGIKIWRQKEREQNDRHR